MKEAGMGVRDGARNQVSSSKAESAGENLNPYDIAQMQFDL
jgi:hypothetical protein